MRIWDVNTHDSKVLPIDDHPTNKLGWASVAISPDARFIAAGYSFNAVVRIWDVASGTLVNRLYGHGDGVLSVAFTPDGKGLVSGLRDGRLKCWELNMTTNNARNAGGPFSECILDFKGHKDWVFHVAISRDGQWIVSGSRDDNVRLWDKYGRAQLMLQGHKSSGARLCLQIRYDLML